MSRGLAPVMLRQSSGRRRMNAAPSGVAVSRARARVTGSIPAHHVRTVWSVRGTPAALRVRAVERIETPAATMARTSATTRSEKRERGVMPAGTVVNVTPQQRSRRHSATVASQSCTARVM